VALNVGGTARAGNVSTLVIPRQPSVKRMSNNDLYCMHHEAGTEVVQRLKTCV